MNTIKNGVLMSWIALNVIVLLNSQNFFDGSLEYQIGHFAGFAIITGVGAFVINYVGNKIIEKRRSKLKTT